MNLYFILAGIIAWGVSIAGAGYLGYDLGKDSEVATQAREDEAIAKGAQAAATAAAVAISRIEVKNTTIRQTLEKEVHENVKFVDCRSGDLARSLLNSTIGAAPAASAASGGVLPASGPAR